jgi:hypothetical protein
MLFRSGDNNLSTNRIHQFYEEKRMRVLHYTGIILSGLFCMTLVLVPSQLRADHNRYQPYLVQVGKKSSPFPNAQLTPDQVFKIQLEALRTNDENDRGIEITFRFASPANKRSTGPY